jgi:RHH-type proline utilization regulon transcriptional repressor/proline dehydrogenase/delta 1-pyrroline-5-carboxylate dehydrogenase
LHSALEKLHAIDFAGSKAAIAAHLTSVWPEQSEFIAQALYQQKSGDLPGPTGESNRLRLFPRGSYLCLGSDEVSLKEQLIMALLTGNKVLAVCVNARTLVKPLASELPVIALDGSVNPESLAQLPIAGVAYAGDKQMLRALRQTLAAREGAILPLIQAPDCVADWLHERVTCTDTTAAGGNVSLLAKPSGRPAKAA